MLFHPLLSFQQTSSVLKLYSTSLSTRAPEINPFILLFISCFSSYNKLEIMDVRVLVVLLVVAVVSSLAKRYDSPPPGYDNKLINRPPPPKTFADRTRMYRSAPDETMHERLRRSPEEKRGSVVLSGTRTEQRGGPPQQSVRGEYNHNLWRGKNGATIDANTYYQRNWGGGPKQDYGGGIRGSIPFGRR